MKRISTCGTSKFQLGRIDGDPVLRETRIRATWEYVSSVEGRQQGMMGLYVICGCGELFCTIARPPPSTTCDGVVPGDMSRGSGDLGDVRRAPGNQQIKGTKTTKQGGLCGGWPAVNFECYMGYGLWLKNEIRKLRGLLIVMAAQLIHDRVEMECLEGAWETLEGNARCRFRGTIRFTATSLVHPDEPARTLQRTVEWILPTPTPYRLVEPVPSDRVGDEDPLPEVDSPEDVMSASEADSTEDSGPGEMAISGGSSSYHYFGDATLGILGAAPSKPEDDKGKTIEKQLPKASMQEKTSSMKCFKCLRRGHITSQCPTKKTMIMRGQNIYSSQDEATTSPSSSEREETKGEESSEEIYPQEEGQPLMVKEECKEVSVSSKSVEKKSPEFEEPQDLRSNPFQGGGNDAILPQKGIG
ncbi:hypothetical protein D0Y65_048437 [Glycine soja]|uniref:CCHC-type domain-containing protein n=1 Tax=Glycine soja TaxID=3848 RepID=A0A445FSZ6_GLYSO|nr:hypothetical protein D0Y65_048437 [Glycine soja]